MADSQQNYTLGRGELHFARFQSGTQTPDGERYFGNTPDLSYTISEDTLDHYSSDRGIREKDDSVPLQVDRSGSFTTDNISPENLALFFFGDSSLVTVTAATAQAETLAAVKAGLSYQLGVSAATPSGVRGVSNVMVTDDGGSTTYEAGTDYVVDGDLGRITILAGGSIADASDLSVTYDVAASTRDRVISGATPIEGALRFISYNPKGKKFDYFFPWVSIKPNGDYNLKGDDWQTIPFTFEIQRKSGLEAIYVDGRPATT